MPEGRMLKKRISDSKKLGALKSDSARLLYTWLLPHLDVEGRYSADPDLIKGHVFPKVKSMTLQKIEKLLHELATQDLIILYKSNSEIYLNLKKFHEFQKIDREREAKSKIPTPRKDTRLTHENSRVDHENSSISLNKVNESKYIVAFKTFWDSWPSDRRQKKGYTEMKFMALCKRGDLERFKIACQNYSDYLEYQRSENNFNQTPMLSSTFMNNWEEWVDRKGYRGAQL